MKSYTVIWFYVANYSCRTVSADSAEAAARKVTGHFSESFHKEGRVLVFEGAPKFQSGNVALGNDH